MGIDEYFAFARKRERARGVLGGRRGKRDQPPRNPHARWGGIREVQSWLPVKIGSMNPTAFPATLTDASIDWDMGRTRRCLEGILQSNRVPVAIQPISGPDFGPSRRWVEVLCRPMLDGQPVSPTDVVGYAERAGLGQAFDQIVLGEAVRILDRTIQIERCAVNLTSESLCSDLPFSDVVLHHLASRKLDPRRLCIEVSELSSLRNLPRARQTLTTLHNAGVVIAMDDFGAGHSHLRLGYGRLIDVIKLDGAVLGESLNGGDPDLRVLRAVKAMADTLGAALVVEGVEGERELAALSAFSGIYRQGHAVGPPILHPSHPPSTPLLRSAS